jgi:hypothetical protein
LSAPADDDNDAAEEAKGEQRETDEEILLSQVTAEVVHCDGDGELDDDAAIGPDDGNVSDLLMEPDEDDQDDDEPGSCPAAAESFVAPKLHGKELKSEKWMPINDLALKNVEKVGREKLLSMKLPQARYRRKKREQRERKALYDDLYMSEKSGHGGGNYRDAVQRLQRAVPVNSGRKKALERMKRLKSST